MGKDLILSSNNISRGTLQEPVWDIDSRVHSGKLSIKKISYTNYPNSDWVLMDHIPPQTSSTNWFARNDALGFTGVSQSAIGVESDLTQYFRRAGTFEGAVPGYNQIKIQTVNTNFEGTTDRAYWVFSKETRDAFGRQSEAGENGTLTVGGDSNFLFNKFPLIDSWDFTSLPGGEAKSFYVDPNFVTGQPASGPFIVSHQYVAGNIQCFYLEAGNGGTANANTSVGNLLYYGMQVWIRRYVPVYNPYAIIHQTGADIRSTATVYMTGDSFTNPPIKFMYLQLFIPTSGSSSMDIFEVRLLDTASNNVLQDNTIVIPTDDTNSLAIETNPSSSEIKSGDTLADIIDNSILSNARVGNTGDNIDEIIQFKLNREYSFDDFNRLEVYANHENLPFQIRFLNANYQLIHTQTFYTSTPVFSGVDESLIILKMLGPNPLIGFTASVNDNINSYILGWADESSLADNYIYRKVEEIPFDLGIGGAKELIKGPSKSLSLAAVVSNKDSPYTNFNIPSNDGDHGWRLIRQLPKNATNWYDTDDDLGYRSATHPATTGANGIVIGGDWDDIVPGYDQILINRGYMPDYPTLLGFIVISRVERDFIATVSPNAYSHWTSGPTPFNGYNILHSSSMQNYNDPGVPIDAHRDPRSVNTRFNPTRTLDQEPGLLWGDFQMFPDNNRPILFFKQYDAGNPMYVEKNLSTSTFGSGTAALGAQVWIRNSKSGNVTTKGSYEPDKSIKPVKWENTGEVSFRFEKINERGLIDEDETPKSYSLECHICDCK